MGYGVYRSRFQPNLYTKPIFIPSRASGGTQNVSLSDSSSLSDSFLKQVNKLFAEAIALAESRTITVGKHVAESTSLSEALTATKVAIKSAAETISLSEVRAI